MLATSYITTPGLFQAIKSYPIDRETWQFICSRCRLNSQQMASRVQSHNFTRGDLFDLKKFPQYFAQIDRICRYRAHKSLYEVLIESEDVIPETEVGTIMRRRPDHIASNPLIEPLSPMNVRFYWWFDVFRLTGAKWRAEMLARHPLRTWRYEALMGLGEAGRRLDVDRAVFASWEAGKRITAPFELIERAIGDGAFIKLLEWQVKYEKGVDYERYNRRGIS